MATTNAHLALETVAGDGLRFVVTDDRGLTLALDSGPDATAPSPTEALLAALGACTGMDVIGILRKQRQEVTAYTIELIGQRRDEHPRAFTAIEVVHRLTGRGLRRSAAEDALELSETKYCSIHATLAPGVVITSRLEILEDGA